MNHLSLFTGIGGLDLAAEWAGFKTVGQVEIDDYCSKVLQKHWPDVPRWRDVFDLTGEEIKEKCGSVSLLSGGFPCQPFSCAGKRKGTEDERYLWDELLRIICEVRPKWFVGENVRGLFSIDAGRTFGTILRDLAENGYRVGWLCYGAGDVGAPHRRERVFIVAHSQGGQSGQQEAGNGWQDISRGSEEGVAYSTQSKGSMDRPVIGESEQVQPGGRSGKGDMADTDNTGNRTPGNGIDGNGQTENEGWAEQSFGGACRQGEMANTDKQGMERCEDAGEVGRKGQERNEQSGRQSESKADRATKSSMGRVPSGFPAKVDGNWPAGQWPTPTACDPEGGVTAGVQFQNGRWFRKNKQGVKWGIKLKDAVGNLDNVWPAGPGEQHEWEPPRIATGIKDRVARLKCLGNAVVPQQAYPIFKAIAEIEGVQ